MARLLVILGSGETSPTMIKPHRAIFERLGAQPKAVLLDTPFGFQENADDIASKAVDYFRDSVGRTVEVAGFRTAEGVDPLAYESTLADLRAADWIFAGPGSPTYALRQWAASKVPEVLADTLAGGGCVTFASAAALTLGVATVPVYEIYKSGAEPHWEEGLDLLGASGLRAAVIPHYDNAEGGGHDTRYCYLGERRLVQMERLLPEGAFVLGVDEHTGLVLDLDAGTGTVVGRGVVTVRKDGRSTTVASGETVATAELAAMADTATTRGAVAAAVTGGAAPEGTPQPLGRSPLLESIAGYQARFDDAIAARSVGDAVRAILELDDELSAWAADTLQTDDGDKGRAAMRSMVVRLGRLAEVGAVDPADVVGPFVDLLLQLRAGARAEKRWADSDLVRDGLVAAGVEVNDAPTGTTWTLKA